MFPQLLAQVNGPPNPWATLIFWLMVGIGVFTLVVCLVFAKYFDLWIQARMTGANVGILELVGMSFRKVNPNIIVRSKIMAFQAGLSEKDGVTTRSLEAHYLAGGNVPNVVRALIAANRAGIPMSFEDAAAINLSGRDVLEVVENRANSTGPGELDPDAPASSIGEGFAESSADSTPPVPAERLDLPQAADADAGRGRR